VREREIDAAGIVRTAGEFDAPAFEFAACGQRLAGRREYRLGHVRETRPMPQEPPDFDATGSSTNAPEAPSRRAEIEGRPPPCPAARNQHLLSGIVRIEGPTFSSSTVSVGIGR